jgi:hypothetical protein
MDAHPGVDDLLPAGAIPIASVRGVIYLSERGEECFAWQAGQEASLATTSGLVAIIGRALLNEGMAPVESD